MTIMEAKIHSGRGTAEQLLAFQRLAWSSMVFSMTRRCPLSCAHCITSSRPDFPGPVVSRARAEKWAAELPALAKAGLRQISFTGGEPVLALPAVEIMVRSGATAGIRTAIVTSGAWASDSTAAERIVRRLEMVSHWDLGYDIYHAEGIPEERFRIAVRTLTKAEASFSVRVCDSGDGNEQEAFLRRLRRITGPGIPIILQPVRRFGRASEAEHGTRIPTPPRQPCMATGPFVREDGTVGPCCSGLSYVATGNSPFDYGNVDETGLMETWRRWRNDPLLRLMRLTGLAIPLQWMAEEGLRSDHSDYSPDVCGVCVSIWREYPSAAEKLRRRASEAAVRQKLDELERHLYGSVWREN